MPRCSACYRRLHADRQCPEHPGTSAGRRLSLGAETCELPGYEIKRPLGGGGFAVVYAAVRGHDGGEIALKVSRAATAKASRRFEREARALARVGPPYVPDLFERGSLSDGRAYLAMELLTGSSLATWLGQRNHPPKLSRLGEVVDAVLASLQAVHEAGLVHGDLKPENVFLDTSSGIQARLLDFGVPRSVASQDVGSNEEEREETMEEIVASAEYMAPEQLLGTVSPAVDIYAAGILLYEMMTLRVPFVGDVASIRHGHRALRPPRPGMFLDVPEAIESLCMACLAKEPGRRPASVAELRRLLADAVAHSASFVQSGDSKLPPHGSSVLGDARQPVVVLGAEVEAGQRHVVHLVERNKGVVARQIGRRYVCGFSALDDVDPIQSAIDTARELVAAHGARVVLHIAQLKIRRRRRGHAVGFFGPALQDVRSWKPDREWHGILLTAKVAAVLQDEVIRPSREYPGFYEFAPDPNIRRLQTEPTLLRVPLYTPLVGRKREMDAARSSLRTVLEHGDPGLFTMYGESGLGKSRMAQELANVARELAPDAVLLSVRATRQLLGRSDETLRSLLELLAEHDLANLPKDTAFDRESGARTLGDGLRSSKRPVVLIVDDAQHADSATLDALEYATLDGERVRLWVAVFGSARLRSRRPRWGERANRHDVIELLPLDEASAMELAARLLHPAEYPPAATLQRLARWTGGSPHALEEIVRALKREGVVRKRLHSDSWYVATTAIERLPASPAGQWLAARRLDALPVELGACIRLCAVLGVEFLRDELEWVQNAADRSGAATSSIDTDVGLTELEQYGFLSRRGEIWSFRQAAFQDSVYNLVSSRDRKRIHGDALEFWRDQTGSFPTERVLAAIARHASASGAATLAADAYLDLGDRARARHRDESADQQYTQALLAISEDDHARRMRALGGRGRVRYRIQRGREALQDLERARVHAQALDDSDTQADLLLEEATALDWEWQFPESAERVERARPLVEASSDDALRAKYWCGVGRAAMRDERLGDAVTILERAVELARACRDDRVCILGLITLTGALSLANRYEEVLAYYDELIDLCEHTGDMLHLCAAYANKGLVWTVGSESRVEEDLARAVQLAREVGQPAIEHNAAHNLAEFLHRQGKNTAALVLARRSYELQRFFPVPTHITGLFVARIHVALEQFDEAAEMVRLVHEQAKSLPLTQSESIVMSMLELLIQERQVSEPRPEEWRELTSRAREHLPGEDFLGVLYFRAQTAMRRRWTEELETVMDEARPRLAVHPFWRTLFEQLSSKYD